MQFKQGGHSRSWIGVAVVLFAAAVVLPDDSISIAQENSTQVEYLVQSFPAESALAAIEADGYTPSEARQLLQNRLPRGQDWSTDSYNTDTALSTQLHHDQLYVQGSREYINFVEQHLITIQDFGLKELLYSIVVVEVPMEKAMPIVENWERAGGSVSTKHPAGSGSLPNRAVVPASLTHSSTTSEVRISNALSDEQCKELVGLGKIISMPKIVGQNGAEVNVRVGHEVPFVTYEPVKDENGNDTTAMQPKVEKIHDGISLDLTGALNEDLENLRLGFRFTHSHLKGMDPFTFESANGPLTVQQPNLSSTGIQTTHHAQVNKTMALCSSSIVQEFVAEQKVSLIGRIPYVSKLFKPTAKVTESTFTIILIRCEVCANRGLAPG